jgi:hypothetical protein
MVGKLVPMSEPIHIVLDSPALELCGSALTFMVFFIVGYIGFEILSVLIRETYSRLRYKYSCHKQKKQDAKDLEEWKKLQWILNREENAFWEKHFAYFEIESQEEEKPKE